MIAGLTDGLDGYLARRMNKVSDLGKALDPIADKIFAATLIVLLILFREFPIWLAVVVVGRDLLILLAGLILLKNRKIVPSSNLTGKYAFGSIAFLLGSYVIRFQFGIWLTTALSLVLIGASMVIYTRVFIGMKRTGKAAEFKDRNAYRLMRIGGTLLFLAIFFFRLFRDLF
jgi:CDP-diacylglycerol--glycerol-3-phosphate 3-phosphatidyltransferase